MDKQHGNHECNRSTEVNIFYKHSAKIMYDEEYDDLSGSVHEIVNNESINIKRYDEDFNLKQDLASNLAALRRHKLRLERGAMPYLP